MGCRPCPGGSSAGWWPLAASCRHGIGPESRGADLATLQALRESNSCWTKEAPVRNSHQLSSDTFESSPQQRHGSYRDPETRFLGAAIVAADPGFGPAPRTLASLHIIFW